MSYDRFCCCFVLHKLLRLLYAYLYSNFYTVIHLMFDIASSLSNRVNWQFLAIVKSYVKFNKLMKQEAHGPHRSPKKKPSSNQ